MSTVPIRLTDPDLFGNDAAEDEDATVFASYALARPELADFTSPSHRVCIARAYKGEGKSALLRLSASTVQTSRDSPIVVSVSANTLSPALPQPDFALWIRQWKASIFGHLAAEVGTTIGRAWSDDAMGLVEQAERQGFKARNIVSAILDRLKFARDDIFQNLGEFGRRRIEDTCAEFRSQCPEIDELISAFSRQPEQLKTEDLLKLIQNRILTHLTPQIAGVIGRPGARDIAAFLFEVGIFFGRRELPDGGYEHVSFSEQPTLWRSRADLDRGFSWEIHPVFRQALEIRDASGREYAPPRRGLAR